MTKQRPRNPGLWALLIAALAWLACAPPPPPPEVEPFCADACFIDRDCGTNRICDKTNDGDDVGAADDDEGCCIEISGACDSDDDCTGDEVCLRQPPFRACAPIECPLYGDSCPQGGHASRRTTAMPSAGPSDPTSAVRCGWPATWCFLAKPSQRPSSLCAPMEGPFGRPSRRRYRWPVTSIGAACRRRRARCPALRSPSSSVAPPTWWCWRRLPRARSASSSSTARATTSTSRASTSASSASTPLSSVSPMLTVLLMSTSPARSLPSASCQRQIGAWWR